MGRSGVGAGPCPRAVPRGRGGGVSSYGCLFAGEGGRERRGSREETRSAVELGVVVIVLARVVQPSKEGGKGRGEGGGKL